MSNDKFIVYNGDLDFTKGYTVTDGVLVDYSGTDVNLVVPGRATAIAACAFSKCTDIKTVVIHPGVTRIEDGVFDGFYSPVVICPPDCYAEQYAIEQGIRSIHAPTWCENCFEIEQGEAVEYRGSPECAVVPDGVRRIGLVAGLIDVKRIVIPASVRYIDDMAFLGSSKPPVVVAPEGSYGASYAKEHEMPLEFPEH